MNNPLTPDQKTRYCKSIAGNTRQSGLTARFRGGHTAAFMAVFFVRSMTPSMWAAMREAFGPAGSSDRSVNPHGRPFCLTAKGLKKQFFRGGIMMSSLYPHSPIQGPLFPELTIKKEGAKS